MHTMVVNQLFSTGCAKHMGLQSLKPKQFLALLSAVLFLALLSSGIVTWVAANWQSISPSFKIISVQSLLLLIGASVLAMRFRFTETRLRASSSVHWWYQGLAFLGAVVSGALIALVGQIYQTGADTWQLFALWFLLILPWFVFSPNVFIAALAAVVANTAAVLFLMNNQLLFSQALTTYFLAFLNALLFFVLEQKRAKQESLWAVLSTSILLCAIVIFAVARADEFEGAFALHLLVAALLLMAYNKLSLAPLRLKILAVAVLATAISAYLLERAMGNSPWISDYASTLVLIGAVWIVATQLTIRLWRSDVVTKKRVAADSLLHTVLPVSFSVFLSLSIILVAAFFYMSLFLFSTGAYLLFSTGAYLESPAREVMAISVLITAFFGLYLGRTALISYAFLVLYQMAVLLGIENNYLHYDGVWTATSLGGIPFVAQLLTVLGLIVSVLIYRQRKESWIRFISSLGFFAFLGGIRHLWFMSDFVQESLLFPLVFVVLIYWSFKRPSEVRLPLITAFVLWGIKLMAEHYDFYMAMYLGPAREFVFKNILLAFLSPIRMFFHADDISIGLLVLNSFFWLVTSLASLTPLWALLQLVKNKGLAANVAAVLMGLLVAWLWFARIDVIVPFTLMVLAYYLRSYALYYFAVVLGLIGLAWFYFSLIVPLNQKVYLLLLSGGLFLALYLFSAKWLILADDEESEEGESIDSSRHSTNGEIEHRPVLNRRRFYGFLAVAVLLPIAIAQWQIKNYERVLSHGQSVLLRLLPVDPRSLMQGDYMIINYEVINLVQMELEPLLDDEPELATEVLVSDNLKKRFIDGDSVRFLAKVQLIDGVAEQVLAFYEAAEAKALENRDDIVYLPFVLKQSDYSMREVRPGFSSEFFFNELAADDFEKAKFAEAAVDRGRVMIRNLLDIDRNVIGKSR